MEKRKIEEKYFELANKLIDEAKIAIAKDTITSKEEFIISSAIKTGEFICGLSCRPDAGLISEVQKPI